jgi:hypothetical protein
VNIAHVEPADWSSFHCEYFSGPHAVSRRPCEETPAYGDEDSGLRAMRRYNRAGSGLRCRTAFSTAYGGAVFGEIDRLWAPETLTNGSIAENGLSGTERNAHLSKSG